LRADRERRPWRHRGCSRGIEGVRAVLRPAGHPARDGVLRLMVEYAGNRAAARARRAARAEATSLARRVDWVLVATVGGLVAYGLWAIAGITRHDVPGSPSYYVTRQAIFAAVGIVGALGAVLVDPGVDRPHHRGIYTGTIALMVLVLPSAPFTRGPEPWIEAGL